MPSRRSALLSLAGVAGSLAGCAGAPLDPAEARRLEQAWARPWRTVGGAFLSPTPPAPGMPLRPGTGMFVKLQVPTAVALRGQELLVADLATARLWRSDLIANTLTPIPGAPVGPDTRIELGADLSAWVLDVAERQVLRFARDGRLMQTWRTRSAAPSPSSMALVDGGLALLVGDATLGQWAELRGGGATAMPVRPHRGDGVVAARVDAVAANRQAIFVLDRMAAAVHRVNREGLVLETLTTPGLAQAAGLAVDRWNRLYAHDHLGRQLQVLMSGAEPRVLTAEELGVQHIGGVAVDDRLLAVSDRLLGQVQVLTLREGAR